MILKDRKCLRCAGPLIEYKPDSRYGLRQQCALCNAWYMNSYVEVLTSKYHVFIYKDHTSVYINCLPADYQVMPKAITKAIPIKFDDEYIDRLIVLL